MIMHGAMYLLYNKSWDIASKPLCMTDCVRKHVDQSAHSEI